MSYFLKDPGAELDFAFDWAPWLGDAEIVASAWAVTPDLPGGVTATSPGMTPRRTQALLSGGEPGRIYHVTNRVTLADGRRDERTLTVRVETR